MKIIRADLPAGLPDNYEPFWQILVCPMCGGGKGAEVARVDVPPGYRSANRTIGRLWQEHLNEHHRLDMVNGKATMTRREERRRVEDLERVKMLVVP